jgi:benzoyl-CoA reductase/2-hydroxyglutaryl-CoA dehydratase subunit BcrC/BadD/HgdB
MNSSIMEQITTGREMNLMEIKRRKEDEGQSVVGMYCGFCPRELILAAGAIPVMLCGTSDEPIAAAEQDLPRNLCPLIKSSYGFAITDTCPFFHFSDLVIGETTCDGKKKMFEILKQIKPMHIMQLPKMPERPSSLTMWQSEIVLLREVLQEHLGTTITDEAIRAAIHLTNEESRTLRELYELNFNRPALISGLDLLNVSFQTMFAADRWKTMEQIQQLTAEIRDKTLSGYHVGNADSPRILLAGCPVGLGSEKVVALVEELGGIVVTMQNCNGYGGNLLYIDEEDTRDPILLLAEKYLSIPCSIMTPNPDRLRILKNMIFNFQIDGVIDLSWQACHTFNTESYHVERLVKDELKLPFLHIETDYSGSDRENLKVRIEAFLEMINPAA